jgi:branched-subunit amino acid aminotransferase/4-amino-4-deoxychorismate lyase
VSAPGPGFLPQALWDGALVAAASLRAARPDPGFAEGDGVFETVRVAGGRPVWLADHAARLARALAGPGGQTGVGDPGYSVIGLAGRCAAVIAANGLGEGSLKIIVGREAGGWHECILARPARYGLERQAAGFRLRSAACGTRSAARDGRKTLYRPHHDNARAAAVAAGFDEALWVGPDDRVLEGAVTNVFIVRDDRVVTPPLAAGILPGVARARVMRLAGATERDLALGELREAPEVFVTNALLGIMPVAQVNGTTFNLMENRVTRALMAALADRGAIADCGPQL